MGQLSWTACMFQSGETSYQIREFMGQLVLEARHREMSLLWMKTYGAVILAPFSLLFSGEER